MFTEENKARGLGREGEWVQKSKEGNQEVERKEKSNQEGNIMKEKTGKETI